MNAPDNLVKQIEKQIPLSQYVKGLERDHCGILVTDILRGKTDLWEPFLTAEYQDNERALLLYSFADLGFNFLASQKADWLDKYAEPIEKLFESCLQGESSQNTDMSPYVGNSPDTIDKENYLAERIKSLVAIAGGGMREEFLNGLLESGDLERDEKLDIYLLIAKLQEKRVSLNLKVWETKLDVVYNPELLPVWVYVCRNSSFAKIESALGSLVYDIHTSHFNFSEKEKQYLQTYLIQAIYNYLEGNAKNEHLNGYILFNKI
jgi:hypothetical protein